MEMFSHWTNKTTKLWMMSCTWLSEFSVLSVSLNPTKREIYPPVLGFSRQPLKRLTTNVGFLRTQGSALLTMVSRMSGSRGSNPNLTFITPACCYSLASRVLFSPLSVCGQNYLAVHGQTVRGHYLGVYLQVINFWSWWFKVSVCAGYAWAALTVTC